MEVFSSVCDSASEIAIALSKFINLFAHLDMKIPWSEVYRFQPPVSVVRVSGSRNTAGVENLPKIVKKLWVLVSSSTSHCPPTGDDSG